MIRNFYVTIQILFYLVFVCFYNLYGNSFSVEVIEFLKQLYFFVTSTTLMAVSYDIAKRNSGVLLFVASSTLFIYSLSLSVFNLACLSKLDKVSLFVNSVVLSGLSFFIIFTVILMISLYGRLDQRK